MRIDDPDSKFILLGSLSCKGSRATDIDLLLPLAANIKAVGLDCASDDLAGKKPGGGFGLWPYEDLAREVDKPVDVFLQPPVIGHQLAAVWAPLEEEWVVFSRFLEHEVRCKPKLLTAGQIVELAKTWVP